MKAQLKKVEDKTVPASKLIFFLLGEMGPPKAQMMMLSYHHHLSNKKIVEKLLTLSRLHLVDDPTSTATSFLFNNALKANKIHAIKQDNFTYDTSWR